jgi:hypothetical protein
MSQHSIDSSSVINGGSLKEQGTSRNAVLPIIIDVTSSSVINVIKRSFELRPGGSLKEQGTSRNAALPVIIVTCEIHQERPV